MIRNFLWTVLFCACMAAENRYTHDAQAWAYRVMQSNPTDEEKTLLLNLTYWSWQRSVTLLQMQAIAVEYVQRTGKIMDDAMVARLNPAAISSVLQYPTSKWERNFAAFDHAHDLFKKALLSYRCAAATYAWCTEYLIKEADMRFDIKEVIATLRENSRTARIKVMQEQLVSINALMDNMKKVMASVGFTTRDFSEENSRGLMDCIMQFATPGVFNSFAKFDKNYNAFNARIFGTLASSYSLSNVLWALTENVRVEFYEEHYAALKQACGCDHNKHLLVAAFDADGFVEEGKRDTYL